jgi:DNA-binding transcriptional LysR family regulator
MLINCASSDYLRRRGTPQTLADLAKHDLIHYVNTLGGKSEGFEYPTSGEYRTLPISGPVVVNNSDAYNAACHAGLGLIQAPEIGVREHLARGQLVEMLPRYRPEPMPLSLLYAHRRNLPPSACACSWIGSLTFSGPYSPIDAAATLARSKQSRASLTDLW